MGDEPGGGGLRRDLASIEVGELCSGTVTAVSQSGQLEVALDGFSGLPSGVIGPLDQGWPRPARGELKPGVGFITIPELSWRRFDSTEDIVQVGQRVSCKFL
jgi:small subunit ribosomal protein S1